MKKFFKKIFDKLKSMLSFEEGIDITDDYAVLKRKNIVIKNIIFFSNIAYTIILFVISFYFAFILDKNSTSNWVWTIIFVPVTFVINRSLTKLIESDDNEILKQKIAMYFAAFYMILSAILIYFKLKISSVGYNADSNINIGEVGYVLLYYSLLVASLYQEKKMLASVCKWMLAIITVIHFTITYSVVDSEYATSLWKFLSEFFISPEFADILLRTLVLILYMIVLNANVSIYCYVLKQRKKETIKRQDVQTDYSDVVNDLFTVIMGMRSVSDEDNEHAEQVDKLSQYFAGVLKYDDEKKAKLKDFANIHIKERNSLQIVKKENMTEEDYNEVRRRSEIGAKVAKRIQLEQKCEDIIRTHILGSPTKSFKNEMNQLLTEEEYQIILACDCYVTMRESKEYKRPYSNDLTVRFISEQLLDYFDEDLIDKFLKANGVIKQIYESSF